MIHVCCSMCDYDEEYGPEYNIRYSGLTSSSEFPKSDYAWCSDCKKFVVVQCGLSASEQTRLQEEQYSRLIEAEKSLFKTSRIKDSIIDAKKKLFDYVVLGGIMDHQSTANCCSECGGTSLVYKDVKNELWLCPKCRVGFLELKDDGEHLMFKLGDKYVKPTIDTSTEYERLVEKSILCAFDIYNNELVYYRLSGNVDNLENLAGPKAFLSRIALVYAYLVVKYNCTVLRGKFAKGVTEQMILGEIFSSDKRLAVFNTLMRYIEYMKDELIVELNSRNFLPHSIIETLRNPQSEPSHRINGIETLDAVKNWKVVSDTINAYFKYGI